MRLRDFMGPSDTSAYRQGKWIKRFIYTYWLVIALHALAQLAAYFFTTYPMEPKAFYLGVLTYPTLLMAVVVGVVQFMDYAVPKHSFMMLFVAGTIIAMVIIHLNMDIRIIGALMLLPIIASAIFFRLDLTLFASVLQVVAFVILYYGDATFKYYLTDFDLIAIPLFLLVSMLVVGIIIINGRELVSDLEATLTAKQDLMIENAVIRKLSTTDALTGLYNHISFHEFYEKALEYGSKGAPFHLALIDIDNFKQINDKYGHRTGDLVLARVARVIREYISPADIAARYGGEEFAILLFEKGFEEAFVLMDWIRQQLSETFHEEMEGTAVTVSIGLKSYSEGTTKERLFEDVDNLLYTAKHSGKNKTLTPHGPLIVL
ncbi:GGDEF domain-containing protein [Paenibacillus sp. MMS20-IR301]|uniref:GGDEF domain-containing protein n=1 Tax=Paenibacillus sp. MMS20-IR301 TaxID=2895946 RepID=UPI0028E57138|nr:GGDEF domain-containing protein [Paenibacillus sp. MMS20-IR301]WNS41097.1 GGDEF domain-containing protein [Paenibacillus sp. MMS20-IR301]